MKIQTFTIVAGTRQCNAKCPFCVSKMTPVGGERSTDVNWRNFNIACRFAKQSGVSTVLITGKGEPLLHPEQVTNYIKVLSTYEFPFIELQTNGILLAEGNMDDYLRTWYLSGLTMMALSIVHFEPDFNKQVYVPHLASYIDLPKLIEKIHNVGLSVRLTLMMVKGGIDNPEKVDQLVDFCKNNKVEQLSIRPIARPKNSENPKISKWVDENTLSYFQTKEIKDNLDVVGNQIMKLVHGAVVYDVRGQNVCLTNCLTLDPQSEDIRQLIFFPNGRLRYDWQYEGAVIL